MDLIQETVLHHPFPLGKLLPLLLLHHNNAQHDSFPLVSFFQPLSHFFHQKLQGVSKILGTGLLLGVMMDHNGKPAQVLAGTQKGWVPEDIATRRRSLR